MERCGPTEDCVACFRKSQQQSERCQARFELLCGGEDGPVEARAQEGQPAPQDPAAPHLVSTSTAEEGVVDTEAMDTESSEHAMSSQVLAAAEQIRPFDTKQDETMEQEGQKAKSSEQWLDSLCVLSDHLLTRFL